MSQDKELVDKILDSINILIALDKKRVVAHKGKNLHPSELQLLMFLYHVKDTNITAIASEMGLTKGAISQTLSRLEKKGIISKETFPKKKNELQVQFTKSGEELMAQLNKSQKSVEGRYRRYIQSLTDDEKLTISNFLDRMVQIMEKM